MLKSTLADPGHLWGSSGYQWFSMWENSVSQRRFGNIWRYFVLSQLGGRVLLASSSWVKTRGADKHPVLHGAAPTFPLLSKEFQTQSITSADAEKLFYILVTT